MIKKVYVIVVLLAFLVGNIYLVAKNEVVEKPVKVELSQNKIVVENRN